MTKNEICPKCHHHAIDHVIIGPHGNGCQAVVELDGGHLPSYCGCDYYLWEQLHPDLTAVLHNSRS